MTKYDSTQDTLDHIHRVQTLLEECKNVLNLRSLVHDKSKLEFPEKEGFDNCIPKLKEIKYGTSEYLDCLKEMKPFLDHHYAHNSHHPEYWQDGINDMSLFDIVEMLVDWKAATERMKDGGDIYKSINFNQGRFNINPQLINILINTAKEMGWK